MAQAAAPQQPGVAAPGVGQGANRAQSPDDMLKFLGMMQLFQQPSPGEQFAQQDALGGLDMNQMLQQILAQGPGVVSPTVPGQLGQTGVGLGTGDLFRP